MKTEAFSYSAMAEFENDHFLVNSILILGKTFCSLRPQRWSVGDEGLGNIRKQ